MASWPMKFGDISRSGDLTHQVQRLSLVNCIVFPLGHDTSTNSTVGSGQDQLVYVS